MSQTNNLGKVAITPRGAYSSTAQYTPLDILSYNGSSYLVLQDCMGVTPPNATYYMVVASKGDTGSAGASPTIAAGTVTMLPAGSSATVTNSGTSQNAVFNFGIPEGTFDTSIIANDYSSNKTYSVGDYCVYSGLLYRCISSIETAEAWTPAHWKSVSIGNDVKIINDEVSSIEDVIIIKGDSQNITGWGRGQINPTNGSASSSLYACRTGTITFSTSGKYLFDPKDGYIISLFEYNGVPSTSTFVQTCFINSETSQIVTINNDYSYRCMVKSTNNLEITPSDLPNDVMQYAICETVKDAILNLETELEDDRNNAPEFQLSTKCCYDHLFVNRFGNQCTIPAESIYHVNISRSLGYNIIEAHPQHSSDNVYFVHHLESGKFGRYFHAADGVTDISNISPNEKTWDWIVNNVRYNSNVAKYQTRPTTLEEFLIGCKQNGLMPLLKFTDNNVKEMVIRIMGKNNYIVYEGTRATSGNAVIFRWENYETLEDILTFCNGIGKPLIYGSSLFTTFFTKSQLSEIVQTLHENGYMTAVAYEGNEFWRQYSPLGVDFCGGTRTTNRLESGNLYNLRNIYNTSDFTITNGTVSNNVITLSNGGTITCAAIGSATRQVARVDLEVDFDGVLTLGGLGEFRGDITFNSDDGKLIVSTAVINGNINFILTATNEVTIRDISYKVSEL